MLHGAPKCKIQDVSKLGRWRFYECASMCHSESLLEAENDIVSLASSFLTVQVFRFAFTGGGLCPLDQHGSCGRTQHTMCRLMSFNSYKFLDVRELSITYIHNRFA